MSSVPTPRCLPQLDRRSAATTNRIATIHSHTTAPNSHYNPRMGLFSRLTSRDPEMISQIDQFASEFISELITHYPEWFETIAGLYSDGRSVGMPALTNDQMVSEMDRFLSDVLEFAKEAGERRGRSLSAWENARLASALEAEMRSRRISGSAISPIRRRVRRLLSGVERIYWEQDD